LLFPIIVSTIGITRKSQATKSLVIVAEPYHPPSSDSNTQSALILHHSIGISFAPKE
jgi:hypothetical protein